MDYLFRYAGLYLYKQQQKTPAFTTQPFYYSPRAANCRAIKHQSMKKPDIIGLFEFGCGGPIRTVDLRVMSPTSFQLLHPAECGKLYNYLPCFAIILRRLRGRPSGNPKLLQQFSDLLKRESHDICL